MSALIVDNEIVHYEVLGRGRPLVFLHGWVGSWRDWLPTMQAVSSSYRCYAVDLWGYGDTAKSKSNYSIENQAALIDTFMRELGIIKIALLGHGLGAVVASQFTVQYPGLVDRVLLVGYPYNPGAVNQRIVQSTADELCQWLLNGLPNTDGIRREAVKMDLDALRQTVTALSPETLLANLHKAPQPRLLVYGDNDPAINQPPESFLLNLGFQSHHIFLEDSGHYPMIDDTSKFSRLVKDFLTLEPEESPRNLQLKDEWKRRFR